MERSICKIDQDLFIIILDKIILLDLIPLELTLPSWIFHPNYQQVATDTDIPVSQKLQIRTATVADLTSVAQIIAESFHSQKGFWGWAFPLFRLGIYEDLRHRLTPSTLRNVCLVAVDTGIGKSNHIIGTVELGIRSGDSWTYLNGYFPYLSNLAVHPKYRRYGVASGLLLICEQISQTWGFQDLYLHVLENNHQARQLYFKLGYRIDKVESQGNMFFFNSSRQIFLHKHLI